jgi:plastocyanin
MHPAQPSARTTALGLLAALAAALCAGCSEDRPVREREPVVRVTLDEYAITPQAISVPSGRVELVARNVGRLTHNLRVEAPPKDPDDRPKPLGTTPTAQPGATVRTTVTLKAGTYRLRCTLANHDDLGMYGKLVVRRGADGGR